MQILTWFPVIVGLIILILILWIIYKVRRIARREMRHIQNNFTSMQTAATLVTAVAKQVDKNTEDTPLTLSNLEGVYLPKIRQSYPQLHIEELRGTAGIVLKEFLDSVQHKAPTPKLMERSSRALYDGVQYLSGQKYQSTPYSLHQVLISGFDTDKIKFDLAYKTDRQHKACITFCYMKDSDLPDSALEKKCTNCGAVLSTEAQTVGHCLYCDQVFKIVSEYKWLAMMIKID